MRLGQPVTNSVPYTKYVLIKNGQLFYNILTCSVCSQSFDYGEMCGTPLLEGATQRSASAAPQGAGARSRPWHDFGRQSDADKIQIPKV